MRFPQLNAKNLLGENVSIPGGLSGNYNLLLMPFFEYQQAEVDTWAPFLDAIRKEYKDFFNYYELPTVGKRNFLFRKWLDSVMYFGINNEDISSRTITIYEDQAEMVKSIGGEGLDNIYVVLINKAGEILWKAEGHYSSRLGNVLHDKLREFSNS
jgi:hypothetical protein